ncbi:MAG: hypothetical protein HY706_00175 [Candidatus Hydrogenedentes bacterium]|nr:hypothetical protein [Candidatus Hydrogenedentota bacterium]
MGKTERDLGISNIWVALIVMVLMGLLVLCIETGFLVLVGEQLQVAADAAALGGAWFIKTDTTAARLQAIAVAYANDAVSTPIQLRPNYENAAEGDIVLGRFDRDTMTFTPGDSGRNAIEVVARRTDDSLGGPIPLLFAKFFGYETLGMARQAIAMMAGGTGAGLIVLNESEKRALEVFGSVDVIVDGGAIQVNSDHDQAAYFGGSATLDAVEANVVGGILVTGNPGIPYYNEGAPSMPDPLASLPAPSWDSSEDLGTVSITGGQILTISPGYYSGGISMNNGTLTLQPGIYVLDGAGLQITGSANLLALGVMFYITGTGFVDIHGGGVLTITPPDPDLYSYPGVDTYEGVAIFQARDNTNESTIIGTSLMNLEGTYYFPAGHLNIGGDATKFGNQLIANTMEIFGNGTLIINYDGRFPAPGGSVFLVQ